MTTIHLDPLIAEARRRARRRRVLYAVLVLGAAGVAAAWLSSRGSGAAPPADAVVRGTPTPRVVVEAGRTGTQDGWAMNGLGLWVTRDAGATWSATTPPRVKGQDVVARVLQVQFVDAVHGWVSGADIPGRAGRYAMLFRTTDGGRTWFHSRANCAWCGSTLSFPNVNVGFTLAATTLYRTGDGGLRWQRVATAPFRGRIAFTDARRGWGAGWNGGLYRTLDGGRTWSLVAEGRATLPQHGVAAVRAGNHGFVVDVHTGARHPLPAVQAATGIPVFSAATARDLVTWAYRTFWASHDGGRTWTRFVTAARPKSVWDMQFATARDGWAIFDATLVHTTDGGRHWAPLRR